MTKGIKAKDIRDFEKYARKLNEVIGRIRGYKETAHLYVTPGEFNLMSGENSGYHGRIPDAETDPVVTCVSMDYIECGDW